MIKLYGGARSRASIVQWYLEELGIPYEFVMLDMQAGEHRKPDFLAINPVGKVPAIVDDGFQLRESGAILLYLAEKYSKSSFSPEQRAIWAQWTLFANATLGPGIFMEATREKETPKLLTPLNEHFTHHSYLVGDEFSVADAAVGSILAYIPMMLKLDYAEYPAIASYVQRLTQRPAYQKTIGARAA